MKNILNQVFGFYLYFTVGIQLLTLIASMILHDKELFFTSLWYFILQEAFIFHFKGYIW